MKSPALGNASFKRAPQIMQQQQLLAYAREEAKGGGGVGVGLE